MRSKGCSMCHVAQLQVLKSISNSVIDGGIYWRIILYTLFLKNCFIFNLTERLNLIIMPLTPFQIVFSSEKTGTKSYLGVDDITVHYSSV